MKEKLTIPNLSVKRILLFSILFLVVSCTKTTIINNYNTPSPTDYGFGLLEASPTLYSAIPTATLPAGGGTTIASAYSIEIPTIPFNQGNQGSCASCASAMTKSIVDHVKNGVPYSNNGIIYSPSYIFNQVNLNPSNCSAGGSYLFSNLDILKNQGDCKLTEMTYNQNNCTTQPNSTQISLAASHKIDHYFKLDPINTSTIKQFINIGLPVIVAFKVDNNFRDNYWDPANANNVWSTFGTYINGNHATLLYGWDDSKNAFKMLNQWGAQWGNNGSIWVNYNLVENHNVFYEAYIIQNPANTPNTLQVSGTLNFGNTTVNTSSTKTIQLTNSGNTPINVSNISISSPFSANWTGGSIPAGSTQNVTVTFNPTIVGSVSGTLTINSNASNNSISLQASGVGVQQGSQTRIISISGNLSFGNVSIGQTVNMPITIINNGNSSLTVFSISTPQGFSGNWNGTIAAGGSVSTSIYFFPSNVQSYGGNVMVNSDATSGNNSINASGNGITSNPNLPNPEALWSFDNCNANDMSGNNHHGIFYGIQPSCQTGISLNSAWFTNTNNATSYFDSPMNLNVNSSSFSISVWVKFSSGSAFNATLSSPFFTLESTSGGAHIHLWNHYNFSNPSQSYWAVNTWQPNLVELYTNPGYSTLTNGNWHHFALSCQNSIVSLYMDGNLMTSFISPSTSYHRIMSAPDPQKNAAFDQIRYYNYSLNSSQIQSIYTNHL